MFIVTVGMAHPNMPPDLKPILQHSDGCQIAQVASKEFSALRWARQSLLSEQVLTAVRLAGKLTAGAQITAAAPMRGRAHSVNQRAGYSKGAQQLEEARQSPPSKQADTHNFSMTDAGTGIPVLL